MDSESKEGIHTTIYQAFTIPKGQLVWMLVGVPSFSNEEEGTMMMI